MRHLLSMSAGGPAVDGRCAFSGSQHCAGVPSFVCHGTAAQVDGAGVSMIRRHLNVGSNFAIRKDMQTACIIFSWQGVQ